MYRPSTMSPGRPTALRCVSPRAGRQLKGLAVNHALDPFMSRYLIYVPQYGTFRASGHFTCEENIYDPLFDYPVYFSAKAQSCTDSNKIIR